MIAGAAIAMDGYALFLKARFAVTTVAYPRQLDYTIVVAGNESSTHKSNHYRANTDPADGAIRIFPISDEELAAPPPHPHDFFPFNFSVQGVLVRIGRTPEPPDLLGVPLLSPAYTFGLAYPVVRHEAAADEGNGARPPTIAVVSTQTREYAVTFLGTQELNGTPTYHLLLHPLSHPKDRRLRELWVGTSDYLPRKAIVSGNFTVRPLIDVTWTVTFEHADGMLLIASERANGPLYFGRSRTVSHAEISFDDVAPPSGSPVGEPLVAPEETATTLVEPAT